MHCYKKSTSDLHHIFWDSFCQNFRAVLTLLHLLHLIWTWREFIFYSLWQKDLTLLTSASKIIEFLKEVQGDKLFQSSVILNAGRSETESWFGFLYPVIVQHHNRPTTLRTEITFANYDLFPLGTVYLFISLYWWGKHIQYLEVSYIQYLEIKLRFLWVCLRVLRLRAEETQRNNTFRDYFSSKDWIFREAYNDRNSCAQVFEKGRDLKC